MNLTNAADAYRVQKAEAEYARQDLITAVRQAYVCGVSEAELAREVGVQRQTIRTWLGK
jgi:DNA-binding XRE family transcriptional regulator